MRNEIIIVNKFTLKGKKHGAEKQRHALVNNTVHGE